MGGRFWGHSYDPVSKPKCDWVCVFLDLILEAESIPCS